MDILHFVNGKASPSVPGTQRQRLCLAGNVSGLEAGFDKLCEDFFWSLLVHPRVCLCLAFCHHYFHQSLHNLS